MVYSYEFEMAATTVTMACVAKHQGQWYVLLGKRQDESPAYPGAWCLPGGFLDVPETSRNAASRELKEEINLNFDSDALNVFFIDDEPGLDPRYEQVINICYYVITSLDYLKKAKHGSDLQEVKIVKLDKVPKLAFNHNEVLTELSLML